MNEDSFEAAAFERLVVEELDRLPDDAVDGLENVVFTTEDAPDETEEADGFDHGGPGGEPGDAHGHVLLGRYEGVDLTRRDRYGFGELPDRIVLFRRALLAAAADEAELRQQVRVTLLHEIGHYYGLDDERLTELGWG